MSNEDIKRLRQAAKEIAAEGHNGWGNTCLFAADALEEAQAKFSRLEKDRDRQKKSREHWSVKAQSMEQRIEELEAQLKKANAREKTAFMAGIASTPMPDSYLFDEEQAWSEYRCQDDADWKATETAGYSGLDAFGYKMTDLDGHEIVPDKSDDTLGDRQ